MKVNNLFKISLHKNSCIVNLTFRERKFILNLIFRQLNYWLPIIVLLNNEFSDKNLPKISSFKMSNLLGKLVQL